MRILCGLLGTVAISGVAGAQPKPVPTKEEAKQACSLLPPRFHCPAGTVRKSSGGYLTRHYTAACERWCERGGKKQGPFVSVEKRFDEHVVSGTYQDGKQHGEWRRYRNGALVARQIFRRGRRHGVYETRHPNGSLAERALYDGDKLNGTRKTWDSAGRLKSIGGYKAGKRIGAHVKYSGGSRVAVERYDRSGRAHGKLCYWHKQGKSCVTMTHGTGVIPKFDDNGDVKETNRYVRGDLRRRIRWARVDCGRPPYSDERFRNGKRDGVLVHRMCRRGAVTSVTRGRSCAGNQCGVWTVVYTGSKQRERYVYDNKGNRTAVTTWDAYGRLKFHSSRPAPSRKHGSRAPTRP